MVIGYIKRFRPRIQSYGFIHVTSRMLPDVFFHRDDCLDYDLHEGDEVEFELEKNDKGYRAKNVKLIGKKDSESHSV